MIIVMKGGCGEQQVHDVSQRLEELGYVVNPIFGVECIYSSNVKTETLHNS